MRGRTRFALGGGLVAVVMLGACAEATLTIETAKSLTDGGASDADQRGRYKVGPPYTINGRSYTPRDDMAYDEVGMASWYGPKFHGRSTANGERFDQNALTAAHRTLPLPSMVRVTNLENGRSIDLRVNDRGPFAKNRIIDVSKRAAELLGFRRQGKARVRVSILPEESLALRQDSGGPPAVRGAPVTAQMATVADNPVGGWYIQAGAFTDATNARRVVSRLASLGPAHLSGTLRDGRPLTRVRIGPLPDSPETARLLRAVQASGYPEARLVAD